MLSLLRRLKYEAFERHPNKVVDIEAELASTLTPRASGEVEYRAYDDDSWYLDVELEHHKHSFEGPFDLRLNGLSVLSLEPGVSETKFKTHSKTGDAMPNAPKLKDLLEVVHNGQVIFAGRFVRD